MLAYVFFALVTRSLGATDAAPVSVLWTWWSFAAAAFTFPVQHWIVRTVSAAGRSEGGVAEALPRVAAVMLGLTVLTGLGGWLLRDSLFHRPGVAFPALVAAVTLGSAFIGVVRGVLTARDRLAAVGVALVAENGLRCLVAGALIVLGSDDARLFGLALAAGHLVGLFWPDSLRLTRHGTDPPATGTGAFLLGAAGGQLVGQAVLTSGPVVLALVGGTPAQVTGLFAALALFRLPYTLAVGSMTPLTGVLTRLSAREGPHSLVRVRLGIALGTVLLSGLAAGFGYLLGPPLLRLVFGETVVVADSICAIIATGSTLALGALLMSLPVMAADRTHVLARSWTVAALAGAVVVVIGPGSPVLTVAVAFLVAEGVAVALIAAQGNAGRSGAATG